MALIDQLAVHHDNHVVAELGDLVNVAHVQRRDLQLPSDFGEVGKISACVYCRVGQGSSGSSNWG